MDDIVQLALDPAVTFTVIACLVLILIVQSLDHKRRMRNLAKRLGQVMNILLTGVRAHCQQETMRKVVRAIELTFELKEMNPDLTLDEVLFGTVPQDPPFPDLKELRRVAKNEVLGASYDGDRVGGGSGLARGDSASVDDFLADMTRTRSRSPRAG